MKRVLIGLAALLCFPLVGLWIAGDCLLEVLEYNRRKAGK